MLLPGVAVQANHGEATSRRREQRRAFVMSQSRQDHGQAEQDAELPGGMFVTENPVEQKDKERDGACGYQTEMSEGMGEEKGLKPKRAPPKSAAISFRVILRQSKRARNADKANCRTIERLYATTVPARKHRGRASVAGCRPRERGCGSQHHGGRDDREMRRGKASRSGGQDWPCIRESRIQDCGRGDPRSEPAGDAGPLEWRATPNESLGSAAAIQDHAISGQEAEPGSQPGGAHRFRTSAKNRALSS